MDSTTSSAVTAHRRVGAVAVAAFLALLLLGAVHGPAEADPAAPAATPTTPAPAQPAPADPYPYGPGPEDFGPRGRGDGPGFGGPGRGGDVAPAPSIGGNPI